MAFRPRHLAAALLAGAALALSACAGGPAAPARSSATPTPDPGYGLPLDVSPSSPAAAALADQHSSLGAADRDLLRTIADEPTAVWISDPPRGAESHVRDATSAAERRHALPVLVAYAIPDRDCGGLSASGAPLDADGYRDWVARFANGLEGHRAVVIVEPDALDQFDCLSGEQQTQRIALLADAVSSFADAGADVYLDAGHSGWVDAATIADRLRQAGVEHGRGFSLNVSNFRSNADEIAYGHEISQRLGGVHFVIDTSRNGRPSDSGEWCNPWDRALGTPPTVETGDDLVDAFLWIKPPGNSDGTCNGGPPAGHWWEAYALMLAKNAGSAG